jgi:hypothetical protein
MISSAIATFLMEKAGLFHDFSAEQLRSLASGSQAGSFEANEAIAYRGAEATHHGGLLSGIFISRLSAGLFFAVVGAIHTTRVQTESK